MDFDFITPRLATGGGIASAAEVIALASAGISHIVDCRIEVDDAPLLASHPSIMYCWDPTADDGAVKPPSWFGKGIAFALAALAQPKNKVYAHCAQGINRGPSMTYAVMLAQGFTKDEARALIVLHRLRTAIGLRYADDAEKAITALGYD